MHVKINGKENELGDSITITQLLNEFNLQPQQVAVEVNREIIKRDQFETYVIANGDDIEILRFVGGGESR